MSPRTIRLGYLIELVIALGVGLGVSRNEWNFFRAQARGGLTPPRVSFFQELVPLVDPFLAGVAVVHGVGLVGESIRGRGPKNWGLGRRTWAVVSLYLLIETALDAENLVAGYLRGGRSPLGAILWRHFQENPSSILTFQFAAALAAVWITARWAGLPGDPAPDAREWTGRVFGVVVLTWGVLGRLTVLI